MKNNNANYNILVVDDEPLIRKSLYEILRIEGYSASMAETGEEVAGLLEKNDFDIVITDMKLPQMNGLELLTLIKRHSPETEIILITGYGTIETAVEAIKKGAFDYITKPIVDSEIKLVIKRITEKKAIIRENQNLKRIIERAKRDSFCGMIGVSEPMRTLYNLVESIASTNATIMISGESGTGKGVLARTIHQCDQNRKDMPFVEVSCGALSETLLESELFGHVKGAFTGAIKDKKGRFEMANGGTIFLDEIDSFSPNLQVKLLRILQDGGFERVGDTQARKTDARIIVATNQDLEKLVEKGTFREDLYYRINVIPIHLPPLRDRKGDIELLVQHFISLSSVKNNKSVSHVSPEVKRMFLEYHWPGNIRQLENVVEGAVIMSKGTVIERQNLPRSFDFQRNTPHSFSTTISQRPPNGSENRIKSLKEGLEEPAKELILATLKEFNWNRSKAADHLGINRTTLYNKMKKYGISFK